ncbi:MAG: sortase [Patescibacteria group bacterium]
MEKTAHQRGLMAALQRVSARKWIFLASFAMVFFFSYSLLASMGLDPVLKVNEIVTGPRLTASALNALPVAAPTRMSIPSLGRTVTIANPTSTNIAVLDELLLKGAVRYPTSAKLGEEGNVVLFGHSSYLPVVHNAAYKAFNDIQNLKKGDRIEVEGNGLVYVYAVDKVYEANAGQDAIPLTSEGHTLTLVTCDSFASKQDRFVVMATLVESYPVAN